MGITADIKVGVFSTLSAAALGPVAWPNIPYTGDMPYLRVHVMPASADAVGVKSIDHHTGVIQVDCVVASGGGEIAASTLADSVIALFPRNSSKTSGTTKIRFTKTGWASGGQQEPDRYFIPVTIPYEVIK